MAWPSTVNESWYCGSGHRTGNGWREKMYITIQRTIFCMTLSWRRQRKIPLSLFFRKLCPRQQSKSMALDKLICRWYWGEADWCATTRGSQKSSSKSFLKIFLNVLKSCSNACQNGPVQTHVSIKVGPDSIALISCIYNARIIAVKNLNWLWYCENIWVLLRILCSLIFSSNKSSTSATSRYSTGIKIWNSFVI